MPAPRFRLQSVLNYREQIVEVRQQELATLERELQKQRLVLQRLRGRMADVAQRIQARQQAGRLDCELLLVDFGYLQQLQAQEQEQIAVIAQVEQRTEAKRGELRTAVQDKQVLEKLKERQIAHRKKEDLRKEGQVLDEIGVMRFYQNEQNEAGS